MEFTNGFLALHYDEGTFCGLAQTSRQLRREFRPLWIRNSWWLFDDFQKFGSFMDSFYPSARDYCSAPRLFRIEWHNLPTKYMPYGSIDNKDFDITSLLRLRASCPSLHIDLTYDVDFLHDRIWRTCLYCDAPLKPPTAADDSDSNDTDSDDSDGNDIEGSQSDLKRCHGRRHKIDQREWNTIKDSKNFIQPLNNLLAQILGSWTTVLRQYIATQQLSVPFAVDLEYQWLWVHIDFHPRSESEDDVVEFASRWLEKHGFRTYWEDTAEYGEVRETGMLRSVTIVRSIGFRS